MTSATPPHGHPLATHEFPVGDTPSLDLIDKAAHERVGLALRTAERLEQLDEGASRQWHGGQLGGQHHRLFQPPSSRPPQHRA